MKKEKYRLGCVHCDRDDGDFITQLPEDWFFIEKVSRRKTVFLPEKTVDRGESVFDWQTHLGVCPDCFAEQGYEEGYED
jgi:hypothetical protein